MAVVPSEFVSMLGQRYRGCYSRLDALRTSSRYPTVAQAERLLAERYGAEANSAAFHAPVLCGAATWNIFKRIYSFNEILAEFLIAASEGLDSSTDLPLDGLRYLPLPCIYIQAPNAVAEGVDGFFAWVEEVDDADPVLRLLFVFDDLGYYLPSSLRLLPDAPLGACLPDALATTEPLVWSAAHGNDLALGLLSGVPDVPGNFSNPIHNLTVRGVQLLLYLVSMDADVADAPAGNGDVVTTVPVGKTAGERLRQIATQKRSHIRQGHWHKYWVGPKNGDRKLVARWIEPFIVGDGKIRETKITVKGAQ